MTITCSRALSTILGFALAVLGGGCGSVTMPSVSLPNTRPEQTRVFAQEPDVVYAASRAALEAMNYSYVRGSRSSGKLEMASRVLPGSALLARQRQVSITVVELDDGSAELRISIMESSEDESAGGTRTVTNRRVRDEEAYDVFWSRLSAQLDAAANPSP
jgi:hypothetical protein